MALYNVGNLILHLRKERGLTQEQLAEGICARDTISRIEKGTRRPDWYTFANILTRLGHDPEAFHSSYADKDEFYVWQTQQEMEVMLREMDYAGLKAKLDELESHPLFAPPSDADAGESGKSLGYELCLVYRANLHSQGEHQDPALAQELIEKVLKLRRPDFSLDKIEGYYLTFDEFLHLNTLATCIVQTRGLEEALGFWQRLKACYEKHYSAGRANAYANQQARVAYGNLVMNIAIALKLLGRHEECLAVAEEQCGGAIRNNKMMEFSRYLYQRAFCLMKLGRRDEGRPLYRKFFGLADALDGHYNISLETVKKEYEEQFGEPPPQ